MKIEIDSGHDYRSGPGRARFVPYVGIILHGNSVDISVRKYKNNVVMITKGNGLKKGIMIKLPIALFNLVRDVNMLLKKLGYESLNPLEVNNLVASWNRASNIMDRRF